MSSEILVYLHPDQADLGPRTWAETGKRFAICLPLLCLSFTFAVTLAGCLQSGAEVRVAALMPDAEPIRVRGELCSECSGRGPR